MSEIYSYVWTWIYQKYICSGIFHNIQVILKAYCNAFITITTQRFLCSSTATFAHIKVTNTYNFTN